MTEWITFYKGKNVTCIHFFLYTFCTCNYYKTRIEWKINMIIWLKFQKEEKSWYMYIVIQMRISGTLPSLDCLLALYLLELFNCTWEWKWSIRIRGWSYIEHSELSCVKNRSVVGLAEWGLVSPKDGDRSGGVGFERGCIRDTARIQRGFIRDGYALQSEQVIF